MRLRELAAIGLRLRVGEGARRCESIEIVVVNSIVDRRSNGGIRAHRHRAGRRRQVVFESTGKIQGFVGHDGTVIIVEERAMRGSKRVNTAARLGRAGRALFVPGVVVRKV